MLMSLRFIEVILFPFLIVSLNKLYILSFLLCGRVLFYHDFIAFGFVGVEYFILGKIK